MKTGYFKAEDLKRVDLRTLSSEELLNVERSLQDVLSKTGAPKALENLNFVRLRLRELELS